MNARSFRVLVVVPSLLVLALVGACSPHAKRCEDVCLQFISECGWTAWENLAQCQVGCEDDTYRRGDADELLDCYTKAAGVPSLQEATVVVDQAIEAGFFAVEQLAGTFDRDGAITAAIDHGTCDAFAVVQCRAEAVTERPKGVFIKP